jgi:hypothetical protein
MIRQSSSITGKWLSRQEEPLQEVEVLMVEAVLGGEVISPEEAALAVSRVQLLKFQKWNN